MQVSAGSNDPACLIRPAHRFTAAIKEEPTHSVFEHHIKLPFNWIHLNPTRAHCSASSSPSCDVSSSSSSSSSSSESDSSSLAAGPSGMTTLLRYVIYIPNQVLSAVLQHLLTPLVVGRAQSTIIPAPTRHHPQETGNMMMDAARCAYTRCFNVHF